MDKITLTEFDPNAPRDPNETTVLIGKPLQGKTQKIMEDKRYTTRIEPFIDPQQERIDALERQYYDIVKKMQQFDNKLRNHKHFD